MALPPARTQEPSPSSAHAEKKACARALRLFHEAARRVPAYKDFLKRNGVRASLIRTSADFKKVPLTDKPNYFSQYSLEELSWDGTMDLARYVSTSSGSTGVPFFWPRGRMQNAMVGSMFTKLYDYIFDAREGNTLFVNSFALGTWIAGLEFYNATKWTADTGNRVVISTPGIDKGEAINQVRRLAPSFSRIVISGYPPFVKEIIEQGAISGIQWDKYDTRLLVAGEAISELWRDRLLKLIGKPNDLAGCINVYGMAEAGAVAHDTPLTAMMRRYVDANPGTVHVPEHETLMGMYQYYPLTRYFEIDGDTSIVLTTNAGLPLVRYETRDNGGILSYERMKDFLGSDDTSEALLHRWQLPAVYLFGRKDLSISLYALNIYVENIKQALETSNYATHLSGLFTMSVDHTENLDQQFSIVIELARDVLPSTSLNEALTEEIVQKLCKINSEYAKLYSVVHERARPKLTLAKHGEIATVPGRKHKWVKKD